MSHHLGLKVIAEGVETKEQMDILTKMNCDFIQGYYFCKPLDKTQFRQFLLQRAAEKESQKTHRA